jgi:predicted deacylase
MTRTIHAGTLAVRPGEKQYGPLPIAKRPDGTDVFVPLMIVNGTAPGPTLFLDSAVHGDEYEGSEAIRRLYRELNPARLKGAVIGVPIMNPLAFEAGTRVSPADGLNLNRCWPGRERGFFTERLAARIMEVAKKADYALDCHGGGNIMSLAPVAIYRNIGGPAVARRARDLVRATGLDLVWVGSGGFANTFALEMQKAGIPASCVEIMGEGRAREEVTRQFHALFTNVMRWLKMVPGTPTLPKKVIEYEGTFINTIHGGFYQQTVELRQKVKRGQLCGTVSDFYGEVVEEIRAPYDGIVASKRTFGTLPPGGWTLMVGKIR